MTEAGLDIKDPKNCNRFPPLGGIRWHRVVLDVRPHIHLLKQMQLRPVVTLCHVYIKPVDRASRNTAAKLAIMRSSADRNGRHQSLRFAELYLYM